MLLLYHVHYSCFHLKNILHVLRGFPATQIVLNCNIKAYLLVIHRCLVVLRRLLMVLWVLVGLLLVVRDGVDPHVAIITTPLRVSYCSGGEVGGWHHDGGLHGLLPHLTAAAAFLWKRRANVLDKLTTSMHLIVLLYLF